MGIILVEDPIWAKVVNAASNSDNGGRLRWVNVNRVMESAAGESAREVTSQSAMRSEMQGDLST